MTVYVDDMFMEARVGRLHSRWCHLMADTPEELHAFAQQIGLQRRWAQHEDDPAMLHYDVTEGKRAVAVAHGAVEITWREAGQRVRDHRREHGRAKKKGKKRG